MMSEISLRPYVIYGPPKTLEATPSGKPYYIVLKWIASADRVTPTSAGRKFETLAQAREYCQSMGLSVVPREPEDDPSIIETWI